MSRGFSTFEALVFLLLSAVLLATLAGFSVQEFRTARALFGTIWADRLLETLEFSNIPENTITETVLQVPPGFHDVQLVKEGNSWKLLAGFNERTVSKELRLKPVFEPSNLLEIPGRHNVVVWKENGSVLIRKI